MTGTVDFVLPPLVQSALDAQVDAMTAQARADAAYALAAAASGGSSALTTKGDLLVYTTDLDRLGVGTDGQVLTADAASAAGVKWADPTGGGSSSPLTTKGDLYVYSTTDARLAVGTDGQVLIADSGQTTGMRWGTNAPAYSAITSIPAAIDAIDGLTPAANKLAYYTGASAATLTDLTAYGISLIGSANAAAAMALITPTTTNGDIIVHSGGVATRLAKGTDGQVLTMVTGAVAWANAAGGSSPLTTKGDLFGFSTVAARIPVGTDGQVLTADSTQTLGVKWAAAGAASAGGSDTQIQFNDGGSLGGDSALTWNKTTNNLTIAGGTLTSALSGISYSATWDGASQLFAGLRVNITRTSYDSTNSGAIIIQDSGTPKTVFKPDGYLWVANEVKVAPTGIANTTAYMADKKIQVPSDGRFAFSPGPNAASSPDVVLERFGSGTFGDGALALKNGTNPQILDVFGTYTSSTSYEALSVAATANNHKISAIKGSGGGSLRPVVVGFYAKSGDPTTTELPDGYAGFFKDTGSGLKKLWMNDGGTLVSVTLA